MKRFVLGGREVIGNGILQWTGSAYVFFPNGTFNDEKVLEETINVFKYHLSFPLRVPDEHHDKASFVAINDHILHVTLPLRFTNSEHIYSHYQDFWDAVSISLAEGTPIRKRQNNTRLFPGIGYTGDLHIVLNPVTSQDRIILAQYYVNQWGNYYNPATLQPVSYDDILPRDELKYAKDIRNFLSDENDRLIFIRGTRAATVELKTIRRKSHYIVSFFNTEASPATSKHNIDQLGLFRLAQRLVNTLGAYDGDLIKDSLKIPTF